MNQKDFVLNMIIAFTQHHGYSPSKIHINEWKKMYRDIDV
jgi:hypothetical protein